MSDFQIPGPEGSAYNPEYDGVVEREITCRLEGELSGSKKRKEKRIPGTSLLPEGLK